MNLYRTLWPLLRLLAHAFAEVEVEGRTNLPSEGGCILVPNHQSILDPLFVQAYCTRPVHTLTKSTQFSSPFFRWFLPRVHAIPTRRFQVDPQVVRVILRRLEEGKMVGIYAEGERSWDGRLQPLRRGTLRVILKAGAPVVPCGVVGTYDAWPRWTRKVRRGSVRIRFGKPLRFGVHDTREEREDALPEARRALRNALLELTGLPQAVESGDGMDREGGRDGGVLDAEPPPTIES